MTSLEKNEAERRSKYNNNKKKCKSKKKNMRPLNIKELVFVPAERLKKKDAPKKVIQKHNRK